MHFLLIMIHPYVRGLICPAGCAIFFQSRNSLVTLTRAQIVEIKMMRFILLDKARPSVVPFGIHLDFPTPRI